MVQLVASSQAVLLVMGDGAAALADTLCASPNLSHINTTETKRACCLAFLF